MPRALARLLLMALLPAASGCTALVLTGAVVGAGAAVVGTTAKAGVAVGKGVVTVATAPFGSDKDK